MKRRLLPCLALGLGLGLASPAAAEFPGTVAEGSILSGWRAEDGTHYAALTIRLAPGWKTYWRAPGDTGIPPQFNWSGSRNLTSVGVAYPVPKIIDQAGLRTIGYEKSVTFPLALTPADRGQDIRLSGEINIGVCEDICLPYTLKVDTVLPASATAPSSYIQSVIADRPMTEGEAGVAKVACDIAPTSDGLSLTARIDVARMGREEIAVVELPDRAIWISEADVSRDGATLTASVDMVAPTAEPFSLARSDVRITVFGGGQAVDIRGCD